MNQETYDAISKLGNPSLIAEKLKEYDAEFREAYRKFGNALRNKAYRDKNKDETNKQDICKIIDSCKKKEIIDKEELSQEYMKSSEYVLYNNITISTIAKLVKDNDKLHYYLLIFSIFRNSNINDDDTKILVECLKKNQIDDSAPEEYKHTLEKIIKIGNKESSNSDPFNVGGLTDTSIGKLAKDIVSDLDLSKIKQSIEKDGDILSALGSKESGLGDLLSNVSKKMSDKLASGEINQQELLGDALKFAGNIGGGGKKGSGMPDLSSMMKMMSSMGGMPNMSGAKAGKVKQKMAQMTKKNAQVERMKQKLEEKS